MLFLCEFVRLLWSGIPFLWGFISGGTAFPKPLSAKEEKQLLAGKLQGDTDAENRLIEHNLRLVAHVAGKYRRSGLEMDDLISVGTIGLIKAVRTYDPTKGKPLASYTARCIENEILMLLRAGKKQRQEISLDEPIGMDREGNVLTLMEVLSLEAEDVMDAVEKRMQTEAVCHMIDTMLPQREAEVLQMRYGLGGRDAMTQQETAEKLGISRSYVSRIETKALNTLRTRMKR